MKIDFHTHCFPDRIAKKAIDTLSYNSGGLEPQTDGTLEGLKTVMKEDGINISVIANIATNKEQMVAVNNFAASVKSDDIIPFGSVHPQAENVLEELERIKEMGLRGVKFHPDYQNFFVDEEFMKPIYRKIGELGLVTLFHSGQDIGFAAPYHGMPQNFKKALLWFDSSVVLAHWGGAFAAEQVIDLLAGENVYFDTSFGYGTVPKPYLQQILDKHGTDRILFGSDMPWQRPSWIDRVLNTLDISKSDLEKIYYKNAKILLRL